MNKNLTFTQEQITEILSEITSETGGLEKVLSYTIDALMKSERQVHNQSHQDVSNGYRQTRAFSQGKELKLSVPRTRYGEFYPVILGLLRNQEEEARKIAFELYGSGLTTGQVGELFGKIYGKEYSTSQVSKLFDEAREEVQDWLYRPLESYYPIVYIDAVFISTRRGDSVSKEAYYTVLAVRPDKTREVLAVVNFPTESASNWASLFQELKSRGLEEIDLVVSDALVGIEDSVQRYYNCEHQFCVVHLKRNVLNIVKTTDRATVSAKLTEICKVSDSSYTVAQAWEKWEQFSLEYGKKYPRIKAMNAERYKYYFTYLNYNYRIQSMLYTTNWIERLNRDYRRTTKMRGSLPNPEATLLLLGYVAMNKSAYRHMVSSFTHEKEAFKWGA